jgi:NitT/TauT family transport system substrate-binding protein
MRDSKGSWLKLMFGVLCIALVALVVAGCGDDDDDDGGGGGGGGGEQTQAETQETEDITVTLPFQDSIIWSGYEISKGEDGPFAVDAGLVPETQAVEGNSATIQQLISGQVDWAVTGAPEIFVANARGNKVYGLSTYYGDVFTIAATTDSGTASIADLKGKALGVTDLGGGEIPLVNAALADAGLTPGEDVELKVVGPGGATAFNALKDGEVAAFGGAINDLVPLESQGLNFEVILPEKFMNLPSDYIAVTEEAMSDQALLDTLAEFQKAWFVGVLYGEQYPEDGLARICEQVPEDCQDMEFAKGFYDSAIAISIDEAKVGGCPDYDALTVVRDSVAAVDNPGAKDINPEDVFPADFCENAVPSEDAVSAFAERTGATK